MRSSYRNVKALEAISIINTLLNQDPDAFNGAQIGNLLVLNPFGEAADNSAIDLEQLRENFEVLCRKENADI
jgi:hypothetical protein